MIEIPFYDIFVYLTDPVFIQDFLISFVAVFPFIYVINLRLMHDYSAS